MRSNEIRSGDLFICRHNSSRIFRNYLIAAFVIGFVMPVAIITYCYSQIVYTMNAVHRKATSHNGEVRSKVNLGATRKRVTQHNQKFIPNLQIETALRL